MGLISKKAKEAAMEQPVRIEDTEQSKKKRGLFFKKEKEQDYTFAGCPQLLNIKPKEKYIFHSDYYQVDDWYCCVLGYFHTDGATDNFCHFWGINRIPKGLDDDVTVLLFEQVRRMTEGWLHEHQNRAEQVSEMSIKEHERNGTNTSKGKETRKARDLAEIAQELQDGAAYLNVHLRLLVKAPTLEKLEDSIAAIDRLYIDRYATLSAAPYIGEQRAELAGLFQRNANKKGKGFYFTSTEFAGSYSLVTHGLEDPGGEYVGYMTGDVNSSAVLFDVDNYSHHVVVANESYDMTLGRTHVSDMWGSKMSQACLLNNHRVVHLILDGANLDKLGPKFENISYKIDMNTGDLNMFEMFGDVKDELAIFPAQMQKLVLMAEQAYETTDSDRSIIRGSLEEIATKFYIDKRMWHENAQANRDKLRVTGIPHEEIPKLEEFVTYLEMEHKAMTTSSAHDEERQHALGVLKVTFRNLLSNNGDLFNTITTSKIDGAKDGRRTIYDFSKLMQRGVGVAMAQLVNVISFAAGNLGLGDVMIIHGAELLDSGVKPYLGQQLQKLWDRGGRVAYLYNDIDKMLKDKEFSQFDKADYTLFGNMSDTLVAEYQRLLGQDIPPDLSQLVTNKSNTVCYVRRGFDNVVFCQDLCLGIQKGRRR